MHFALTEEQAAIQETALTFAKERIAPLAAEWDEKSHFPVDVIRETAALGMAAIYVPAEQGGSGLSRLDGALIMEALAYGCPAISGLHLHPQHGGLDGRQVRAPTPSATTGCRSSPDGLAVGLLPDRAGRRLRCRRAQDLGQALGRPLRAQRQQAVHLRRRCRRLLFRVRPHRRGGCQRHLGLRGHEGHARPLLRRAGEEDGLERAADAPGDLRQLQGAGGKPHRRGGPRLPLRHERPRRRAHQHRRLLASARPGPRSTRRASTPLERKAFGRAIADFQALQFKLADMATELEAARLMIYRAADAIDRADPQASMYSAMGKRLATDLGFKIVNDALQVHGGYGYLKDYGLEKLVRDLRVHQILEGTNEIMRVVISRKLLGGNRG